MGNGQGAEMGGVNKINILVTGADGFVGRNLCAVLARREDVLLYRYDVGQTSEELAAALAAADIVYHLAGVNRPPDPADFAKGNTDFTRQICGRLLSLGRSPLIVLSSSTQAELENPYGASKRQAEQIVDDYAQACAACSNPPRLCASALKTPYARIYRLPNVFGKWCRPNYNSAVATWCHNIARGLPIQVRDPAAELTLVYIDDVVSEFVSLLPPASPRPCVNSQEASASLGLCVEPSYTRTLGEITELIRGFGAGRETLAVPEQTDAFVKKLYATYLSFLPEDQFGYPLQMNVDARGSFTEFIRTPERGQVSVNISKPGIVKGNHWHHTKVEKFLVVSGRGVIRFRKIGEEFEHGDAGAQRGEENAERGDVEVQRKDLTQRRRGAEGRILEYFVSGEKLEVIDIPPGYTHNIENVGDTDLVTVMWANEAFDPGRPDTFFEKV